MFDTRSILEEVSHRPWVLPSKPWGLQMQWLDLAFLHWSVSPEILRPLIPSSLALDTFEGKAWIGVVPFRMANVRIRFVPPVPTASVFEELNVRTYVRSKERAGVWFMSLDAASWLAVIGARAACSLPYYHAEMGMENIGENVNYWSRRTHRKAAAAEFRGSYAPVGPVTRVEAGSLEQWLTERYCLFTQRRNGRLHRLDVHHLPWTLRPGRAEIEMNTMAAAAGVDLPSTPPLVHYSSHLDVLAWPPVAVSGE